MNLAPAPGDKLENERNNKKLSVSEVWAEIDLIKLDASGQRGAQPHTNLPVLGR